MGEVLEHRQSVLAGSDISTCLLALASEFLKKWSLGKYILISTCPNRQADFSEQSAHFYKEYSAKIHRNMQTVQQNQNENVFQIIKSMMNNTCHSKICYNLFRASHKSCWASRNH